jgi:ABC-type polysaccharide/polyol phosphate transport system ATPase subunit
MIVAERVTKEYRTRRGPQCVLNGVNFTLDMGERLGVLGRNGAGKSTLIRLVSGAERPSGGMITRDMSVSWPLAFSGAFQLQLTGADNVRFISRLYAQDPEINLEFVEEFAELGSYLREPVRSYSSGMRARLAFAISMIIEFDCFLIDEIAAVGDARFHERCNYELFDKRGDRAMMIISHDPGYLRDHCNRWAVLNAGQLTAFDDFDVAQDHFLALVGAGESRPTASQPFARRLASIDSLRRVAHADARFMALVRRADAARDRHDWASAEADYAAALTLHPYERTYWTQLGHAAREQGRTMRAEIAYRTACAYGESERVLAPFLAAVGAFDSSSGAVQSVAAPDGGPTRLQPPGFPDLALLAALLQGTTELDESHAHILIREAKSVEDAATLLAGAPTVASASLPDTIAVVPGSNGMRRKDWQGDLVRLAGCRLETFLDALAAAPPPLDALRAAGGFEGWAIPRLDTAKAIQK